MNFERITEYLDSLTEGGVPSVDCMIMKDHQVLYRHLKGTSDHERTIPVREDQLYLMFSMTKIQTMTAFMQLVEKGKISLDDEVGKYLPAYRKLMVENPLANTEDLPEEREPKIGANAAVLLKEPLRIRHLISMQSGLDYDLERPGIRRVLSEKGDAATTRELVDAFPESPLKFVPGTHFLYSLSHDVAAAIIEVVSGEFFGDYLKKHIWDPLGMEHTFFASPLNEELTNRGKIQSGAVKEEDGGFPWTLADQYILNEASGRIVPMEPSCNYQLSKAYESGGAGLISCTQDYAILGDAIACGGTGRNGARILKPETVELIKQNLLGPDSQNDIETSMGRVGYGYGCGMQVLMYPEKIGSPAPAGVFGWDGAAGSCLIMDSISHTCLVYTMHVRGYGPAYGVIHPRLRDLMYE